MRYTHLLQEELPNDYDVTAMYEAKPGYSQLIDIRVTDHMGSQLLEKTAIDKVHRSSFTTRAFTLLAVQLQR